MASDNPDIRSDDELWNEFHRVVKHERRAARTAQRSYRVRDIVVSGGGA